MGLPDKMYYGSKDFESLVEHQEEANKKIHKIRETLYDTYRINPNMGPMIQQYRIAVNACLELAKETEEYILQINQDVENIDKSIEDVRKLYSEILDRHSFECVTTL